MPELTHVVTIRAKPGKSPVLGATLKALVGPTRSEKECSAYHLHQSTEDHDVWMVYERWRSHEGAEGHLSQPYVQQFIARLTELVAGPIAIQSYLHIGPEASDSCGSADAPG